MTRDDIIRLAREAGYLPDMFGVAIWDSKEFNSFAALVAATERERCAWVAQNGYASNARDIAAAIRARGK
jgi:hypothetical protein